MLSLPHLQLTGRERGELRCAVLLTLVFTGLLWWIRIVETLFGWQFTGLGVYPRDWRGLPGILFAPLIHGSFEHLFANTLPLLVLGTLLLFGYPRSRWRVLSLIWLGSGLGVWLTAREAHHFGASGLAHGLMFFLFVIGILRRDRRAIVLSMATFFLYGSMVWGIFPQEPGISYESHFWGAVAGVIAAIVWRKRDPLPPARRYAWEAQETEDNDDPVIGDLWKHAKAPEEPLPPVADNAMNEAEQKPRGDT